MHMCSCVYTQACLCTSVYAYVYMSIVVLLTCVSASRYKCICMNALVLYMCAHMCITIVFTTV